MAGPLLHWDGPAIGLLDLDAFFASVEQLDHPEWRGKPVIVGGSPEGRGVVSTASYEARPYGVHSAMPSAQARRLCPDAIWTGGNFARYREMSNRVMSFILDETPLMEQVSIDEAFFDVTPGRYSRESPIEICRRIQGRVSELGITCSIGLGTNKTVAKIGSERQKPRGLTVVPPGTEASFLAPLPVRAMSGIGAATERRLCEMGITTLGKLAEADLREIELAFGVHGPSMVVRAQGLERSQVLGADVEEDPKSVSNERTFPVDLTERDEVVAAVRHVSALVGSRLRRKGLAGHVVTLKLRRDMSHTRTMRAQLAEMTDDEHVFGEAAVALLDQMWAEGSPVRLVGVGVSGFDDDVSFQMDLLDQGDEEARLRKKRLRDLSVAADEVRSKFGSDALSYGRDLRFDYRQPKD
jgi:DNA polymerase-4